ncbi:hypothetical protein FHU14_003489 [Mesorhizobium sp. RMAD-H1]|nr:hypothetical protein [Mesorhizobium sp. RMAD-H1]
MTTATAVREHPASDDRETQALAGNASPARGGTQKHGT